MVSCLRLASRNKGKANEKELRIKGGKRYRGKKSPEQGIGGASNIHSISQPNAGGGVNFGRSAGKTVTQRKEWKYWRKN